MDTVICTCIAAVVASVVSTLMGRRRRPHRQPGLDGEVAAAVRTLNEELDRRR